jgi:hypothetical protein
MDSDDDFVPGLEDNDGIEVSPGSFITPQNSSNPTSQTGSKKRKRGQQYNSHSIDTTSSSEDSDEVAFRLRREQIAITQSDIRSQNKFKKSTLSHSTNSPTSHSASHTNNPLRDDSDIEVISTGSMGSQRSAGRGKLGAQNQYPRHNNQQNDQDSDDFNDIMSVVRSANKRDAIAHNVENQIRHGDRNNSNSTTPLTQANEKSAQLQSLKKRPNNPTNSKYQDNTRPNITTQNASTSQQGDKSIGNTSRAFGISFQTSIMKDRDSIQDIENGPKPTWNHLNNFESEHSPNSILLENASKSAEIALLDQIHREYKTGLNPPLNPKVTKRRHNPTTEIAAPVGESTLSDLSASLTNSKPPLLLDPFPPTNNDFSRSSSTRQPGLRLVTLPPRNSGPLVNTLREPSDDTLGFGGGGGSGDVSGSNGQGNGKRKNNSAGNSLAHRNVVIPNPIQPLSQIPSTTSGTLIKKHAEKLLSQTKAQTQTFNLFSLFHTSPTEAAQYVNEDTIAYLRQVRCPRVFPYDPIDARTDPVQKYTFPYHSHPTSTLHHSSSGIIPPNITPPSAKFQVGVDQFGRPKPIHFRQQVVLSFTGLLVARHVVQNIRNFQHPLHNIYCAHRYDTVFPVSLCGGYLAGKGETTKLLNENNPIVLESSDSEEVDFVRQNIYDDGLDSNGEALLLKSTNPKDGKIDETLPPSSSMLDDIDRTDVVTESLQLATNSPSSSSMFDTMTAKQRSQLHQHVPSFISRGPNGKQLEQPLTDSQLQYLFGFQLTHNSNPAQALARIDPTRDAGVIEIGDNNDDDGNIYTDGVVSSMLDFIKNDIELDRQLRDMLRPLVMADIENDITSGKVQGDIINNILKKNQHLIQNGDKNITLDKESNIQAGRDRFKLLAQRAGTSLRNSNATGVLTRDNHDNHDNHDSEIESGRESTQSDSDNSDNDTAETLPLDEGQAAITTTTTTTTTTGIDGGSQNDSNQPTPHINQTQGADDFSDLFSEDENDNGPQPDMVLVGQRLTTAQVLAQMANGIHYTQQKPKGKELTKEQIAARDERILHRNCIQTPKNASNSEVVKAVMPKFSCPLCLGKVKKALGMTKCGHLACHSCLRRSVSLVKICPICRAPTTIKDVFRVFG